MAELRHGEVNDGTALGESTIQGDIINVQVDTRTGTLFFGRNGNIWPVAWKGVQEFITQKLFLAVSVL